MINRDFYSCTHFLRSRKNSLKENEIATKEKKVVSGGYAYQPLSSSQKIQQTQQTFTENLKTNNPLIVENKEKDNLKSKVIVAKDNKTITSFQETDKFFILPEEDLLDREYNASIEPPEEYEYLDVSPLEKGNKQTVTERLNLNLQSAVHEQKQQISTSHEIGGGPISIDFKRVYQFPREIQIHPSPKKVSIASHKNLENTYLATEITFTIQNKSYQAKLYGVFDGVGASKFIKDNLARYLTNKIQNLQELNQEGIWQALQDTYVEINGIYQGEGETTATSVLILENQIWVANVGNSRAVLNANGQTVQLSVSTMESIGKDKAESSPEIVCYPIPKEKNKQLILASGGIWDVMTSKQGSQCVHDTPYHRGQSLVLEALMHGAKGNLTALIAQL